MRRVGVAKRRHGTGTYVYLDGGTYDGEWVDDKIHGKGVSQYANGNVYDGDVSSQPPPLTSTGLS